MPENSGVDGRPTRTNSPGAQPFDRPQRRRLAPMFTSGHSRPWRARPLRQLLLAQPSATTRPLYTLLPAISIPPHLRGRLSPIRYVTQCSASPRPNGPRKPEPTSSPPSTRAGLVAPVTLPPCRVSNSAVIAMGTARRSVAIAYPHPGILAGQPRASPVGVVGQSKLPHVFVTDADGPRVVARQGLAYLPSESEGQVTPPGYTKGPLTCVSAGQRPFCADGGR